MSSNLLPLEPMDPQLTSIQPGGGVVMQLELLWGRWRRCALKTFRRSYVKRMRSLRQGEVNGCPHEVLDPRDLKFYRNQPNYWWRPEDDPFTWRDRLPFARAGLAELLLCGGGCLLLALAAVATAVFGDGVWLRAIAGFVAVGMLVCAGLIFWFFRNPRRVIPGDEQTIVSPADGVVSTIEEIEHDDFIGGRAVLVGIFLSIFNVHINRMPLAGRIIELRYQKGKFLNALRPESARENEQLAVRFQQSQAPYRRVIVRQITGAIARRIVCWLKPGDELHRGEQFGMIKFGSRTEVVLPWEPGLQLRIKLGDVLHAGSTVLGTYEEVGVRDGSPPQTVAAETGHGQA